MNYGACHFCGSDVYESDERVPTYLGPVHYECKVAFDKESEALNKKIADEENERYARDQKLLKRLQRTLKPKFWQCIAFTIYDHHYQDLEIVGVDCVKGQKNNAHDWFGESVAMRHVYDDTSTDYWGDGYGGEIFLPIGKGRYLKMHVWG